MEDRSKKYKFGEWVKARRELAHLTVNELAKLMGGVTMRDSIAKIEKGDGGASPKFAEKLAKALQIPVSMHKEFIEWANYRRSQNKPRGFPAPGTWPYVHYAQPPRGDNPYKGLQAFREKDAMNFFGRTELVLRLLKRMAEEAEDARFLAVIGPSGSGKSSLVQAGLIPALKQGGELRDGKRLGSDSWGFDEVIRPDRLRASLDRRDRTGRERVLVVDQFEELFTHGHAEAYIEGTLQLIYTTINDSTSKQRIIVTMRADFLERVLQYHPFAGLITSRNELVGTLNNSQVIEVIEEPAKNAGLEFAPDLISKIVLDMGKKPSLPLLQVALRELVNHLKIDERYITLKHYESNKIGGINGALDQWANKIYKQYADSTDTLRETPRQAAMRRLFLRLITVEDDDTIARRKVARHDLLFPGDDVQITEEIITRCCTARLLTLDGEKKHGTDKNDSKIIVTVGIVHEALIKHWNLLSVWVEEHSKHLRWKRRLTADLEAWKLQKDPSFLARGDRLAQYEELKNIGLVQADQIEFLEISRAEEGRAKKEEEKRRKAVEAQVFAASARAEVNRWPQRGLLFALEAIKIWESIRTYHDTAAGTLLRDLLAVTGGIPLKGHADIVRTVSFSADGRWLATRSADGETRVWDLANLDTPPFVLTDTLPTAGTIQLEFSPMVLAFSPDGQWLATTDAENCIQLRDTSQFQTPPVALRGHQDVIRTLTFSLKGDWLISGSNDGTVRLWSLNRPDLATHTPIVLTIGGQIVLTAISPDGHWLTALNWNDETFDAGCAHLWDITQSSPALISNNLYGGSNKALLAVAFGSKQQLAIAADYNVSVWDPAIVQDEARRGLLTYQKVTLQDSRASHNQTHNQWILAVGISHDGRWLATGGGEALVKLWDLTDPEYATHPSILRGHAGAIRTLAFSPDDHWLATGGFDNTVYLWNLEEPTMPAIIFRGHEDRINALAFSADGRFLATASSDGTARLWTIPAPHVDPIHLRQHAMPVLQLALSPDGNWLASTSKDGIIRVGRFNPPTISPYSFQSHINKNWVWDMVFSPDNSKLVIAQWGAPIHIWAMSVENPSASPRVLREDIQDTATLAFDPHGRWLVTGSYSGNGSVYFWDINTPSTDPVVLDGHRGGVTTVAFSQDGNWLATTGWDVTTRLWRMSDAGPVGQCLLLQGHGLEKGIRSIAFSHDSRYLVTPSDTGVTVLWDLEAPDPLNMPIVHQFNSGAMVVAFSSNNKWVAIGVWDFTVQLIHLERPDIVEKTLQGHQGRIGNVVFSPDNRWLASVGEDLVVRLWDLKDLTAAPIILHGHEQGIAQSIIFSPDSRWLITGSDDSTIRCWRVETNDLINVTRRTAGRELTEDERRAALGDEDDNVPV